MEQDPNAEGGQAFNGRLYGAEERDVLPTLLGESCRLGRRAGCNIGGGGKKHGEQMVGLQAIVGHQRGEQVAHGIKHGIGGIGGKGGGTTHGVQQG